MHVLCVVVTKEHPLGSVEWVNSDDGYMGEDATPLARALEPMRDRFPKSGFWDWWVIGGRFSLLDTLDGPAEIARRKRIIIWPPQARRAVVHGRWDSEGLNPADYIPAEFWADVEPDDWVTVVDLHE